MNHKEKFQIIKVQTIGTTALHFPSIYFKTPILTGWLGRHRPLPPMPSDANQHFASLWIPLCSTAPGNRYIWQMGAKDHLQWVFHLFHLPSCRSTLPCPSSGPFSQESIVTRDRSPLLCRIHRTSTSTSMRQRFLLLLLPNNQEKVGLESHTGPQSTQQVHQGSKIEDGHSNSKYSSFGTVRLFWLSTFRMLISILPSHRWFLMFTPGQDHYQYRVFPFGLSSAPRVFSKVLIVVAAHLHF